jgi:hypothetical protein
MFWRLDSVSVFGKNLLSCVSPYLERFWTSSIDWAQLNGFYNVYGDRMQFPNHCVLKYKQVKSKVVPVLNLLSTTP